MEHRRKIRSAEEATETFEKIPLHVAFLAYMGFYILMLLGFISQLLFSPQVAKERNRKVNIITILVPTCVHIIFT